MPIGEIQPPGALIQEEPTVQICINRDWATQLLGMIYPAQYPEWWAGTLEENRFARQQVRELLYIISKFEECGDMAICCEDQVYIYRINTVTGRLERSKDDGATWTTDPKDPLHSIVQQPAPVRDGSSTTKCDAATNFSSHFNDLISDCSENLGTATTIAELAGGIAALLLDIFLIIVTEGAGIAIITTITGAIFTGISAAFAEGKAAFDAYWTTDNKALILCAAFCTMRNDGTWDQVGWEAFKAKARLDLAPGAALDMVLTSVNAAGYVGANNMASYGIAADADCGDCDCGTLRVFVWDELAGASTEIFPDDLEIYTAPSGVTQSGGYYVCSIFFQSALPVPAHWKCATLSFVDVGGAGDPIKYRCDDYGLDPLATCCAQYTFRRNDIPFSVTFSASEVCGEH